jgi:cytochrome c biogenesis protein CcmG, thiol:disulfide interchange protein DsbE
VNSSRLQIAILPLLLMALLLGSCRGGRPSQIGQAAPDFTVKDADRSVTLSQFRGKPVLLNFWATWCPPCVEEMPSMVELQKQLGDKVVILAVSADVDEDAYKKFTEKRTQGLLTVNDKENKANRLYNTYAFPETYVIDRNGVVVRKFIGPQPWTSPEIVSYLEKL